ncbi:membrane protein of ER body-like protein [Chenopodium quinoa]|uniref:membrane protein of ER body-like protein n=1 Tax=Chenopodium quinoa TaxID=63459 RepID=UPI000B77057A|nr:membrane protein of ER body-like protein [Chenopodium quinoa]
MEVQYEREVEEVIGVDLQTRRRSSNSHLSKKTNIITSDLSDTSNFEYSVSMENTNKITSNNKNGTIIITNGEKPKIIEGRSAGEEKLANFDEHNVAQNEDTNGFTVNPNGGHADKFSLPENNGGDRETDIESNTSSVTKNPEISSGLRFVLDDSSNGDNVKSSEFYNGENMVNKTQVISDQNEIVETGQSQEVEPEIDEYEVERVIRKQETHDLICPNCRECITKRVILKRRKRTYAKISEDEPNIGRIPHPIDPDTDKGKPENKLPSGEQASDSIDAVSCFSCFSIFVPKGDGFLCWRFKPKSTVTLQPGQSVDTSAGSMDSAAQLKEDETGRVFPMWILTCCQPSHTERPGKPEPKPSPTSESGKKVPSELPSPPPSQELPVSNKPGEVPEETQPPPTPVSPVTSDRDKDFSLWFLTCCQPSTEGLKPDHAPITDTKVPIHESSSPAPADGAPVTVDRQPLVAPEGSTSCDSVVTPVPLKPKPDGGLPILAKPVPHIIPDDSIPSPPDLKAPDTSKQEYVIVPIVPQPSPIDGIRPTTGIEEPLVIRQPEHPRPGFSGIDIIKAIVYGGLLECITSLSVVSSAAGGDATTLNIVALGLANVFGGLVLLLHNLRVLRHEHATERYIDQLGSPGHFKVHAVIAVLSYLVFGLMSPIIYGFAFRLSDNRDYKLASLAAAALVCIAILSIAKAYARSPPKGYMQTIFYYIGVGFSVSGAGYAAGHLINELLKKLGIFDPKAPVAMSLFEAGAMKGAWSSY